MVKKFGSEKSSVVKNFGSEKFGGEKFGTQIHHTLLPCDHLYMCAQYLYLYWAGNKEIILLCNKIILEVIWL